MQNNLPPVLDVCCGSKSFWFNKGDKRAIYLDIRYAELQADKRKGRKPIKVSPSIMADFQALPFPDNTFPVIVFDPPHASFGKTSYMRAYYGSLQDNWREMITKGFQECFRVLKPEGVLIFKWNETQYSVNDILTCTPVEPLFGHKSGKLAKTHWITFTKPNNACSGFAPAGASESIVVSGANR